MTTMLSTRQQRRLADRLETATNKLLAGRIAMWRTVTREYREFCQEQGVSVVEGAYLRGHPWPFPMNEPMECSGCGVIVEKARLGDEDFWTITLAGRTNCHPDDAEPEESVQTCLWCGAEDSFEAAVKCAECGDYPCVCSEDEDDYKCHAQRDGEPT